ncbi:MAG: hypothetical protein AB4057_01220 [Crocosphaera sp.]
MKKPVFIFLLILVASSFVGCSKIPQLYDDWSCSASSETSNESSSNPKQIIISIDGTPSMRGFVSNNNSRYIRTLRLLKNATTTAFPTTPSPDFFAFGTERVKSIELEQAEQEIFYSGSDPKLRDAVTSQIVIPNKNDQENSLHVVVTDLYQKKAQWEDLVANLKDHYLLKNGSAVGIIAVRSDFRGDIYDIGLDGRTQRNIKTNHPFYILVLGDYSHIKTYFDQIKSGSQANNLNFPDENFIIFSTRVFENPVLLNITNEELNFISSSENTEGSSATQPINRNSNQFGIRRVEVINDGNVMKRFNKNSIQNIERLIVNPSNSSNNISKNLIEYNVNYSSLPYTLPLINSLDYKLNKDSDFNQGTKEFIPLQNNTSSLPINLKNWKFIDNNRLQFNAEIDRSDNDQTVGVYRLIFDIVPKEISDTIKPYQPPSWWKDWSFGEKDFAGNKTYNLEPFLYGLGDTTFRIIEEKIKNDPKLALGKLCFVIQKN